MSKYISEIDTYIEKSQDFAKPILLYLRELIHETAPEVTEAIKWKFPHYIYKDKILCATAAFKAHCAMGFWLEGEMKTIKKLVEGKERGTGFTLGRITSLEDLPSKKQLQESVKEAMDLIDMGVTLKKAAPKVEELEIPKILEEALSKNKTAFNVFEKAAPSFRKEYIKWINEAKTDSTRIKRLDQAMEWIAEGKARHWKYEGKC